MFCKDAEVKGVERFDDESYDLDEHADEVARQRGQIVVYPKPNQIQLDIDSKEQKDIFLERYFRIPEVLEVVEVDEQPSRKGLPHEHITITFSQKIVLTEPMRIALQFMLGSDPIRESLNLMRHLAGHEKPTRLFEYKEKHNEIN